MPVRTAICQDRARNLVPVQCRLWENWHGATCLDRTRAELAREHPDLTFVAWVVEDLRDLRGNFLSPQVEAVRAWLSTPEGIAERRVTRAEVLAA